MRKELDKIHGASKFEVAKVTWARMIRLPTTTTGLSIIENTHSGVKQASNTGLIAIVCTCVCNFHYGTAFNLIGTKDPKLNTNNWFNVRCWPI